MNLGYPFLIYQLCKQARVEVSNQEELLHPIKAIIVRKKRGEMGQEVQGNIDSSNESSEEERNEEDAPEPMDHHEGEFSSTKDRLTHKQSGCLLA